jgi:hypothetical protein
MLILLTDPQQAADSDKADYRPGETIRIIFKDAPGTGKDWIGLFRYNAHPGTAPLVERQYFQNLSSGEVVFNTTPETGRYYAYLYINNSSVRISNRADFRIEPATFIPGTEPAPGVFNIYPSPSSGRLWISISLLQDKDLPLKISSLNGITVLEKMISLSPAGLSEEINLSGISPGFYLVYLQSRAKVFVQILLLN